MLKDLVDKPVVSPPRYRCTGCGAIFETKTDVCPDCEAEVEKLTEEFYSYFWPSG